MEIGLIRTETAWISGYWLSIIGVIVLAIISGYIGETVIRAIIRKFVHGRHFGRPNQSAIDVKKRQDTIIGITVIVWKLLVIFGAGFILLSIIFPEINFLPIFASAGVLGAVIGFGAQSLIKDFISGVFIIAENQFRVGDDIEIDGAVGKVEHITIRSTVIRDDGGNVHYISNGNIMHVINKTMGYSKVYFTLSVTPETDIDKLTEVIESVGKKLAQDKKWQKKIIEAPKFMNLGSFSDTALEVRITGKTQAGDQYSVTTEFKKRLLGAIRNHDDIKLSQYQDLSSLTKKK